MNGRRAWLPVSMVGLLLLGFGLKGLLLAPPAPPAVAAEGEFDTARALGRLQRILGDQRPHSVDTPANDAARERLMAELRAIGLQPRIQEAMDCSAMPKSRALSCSRARNVIATVGDGAGKHVLLNAHYDSTPTGPGAADDGVGVASLLEIAAILKSRPPARPVSFLFNEGEEFGLNGASAFVREDPLAGRVDGLVNIESRGVSGPAIMFETSEPNGAAIAAYANAARRPYANSLSMDFAKLIPNTTDVVEFRPAGWTILNYAIIGNETRYHTPGDTIAALDRASLYHVGSEALAATRALTVRTDSSAARTYVFTDVAGRLFLRLRLPIAGLAVCLLLLLALVQTLRRKAAGRAMATVAAMAGAGLLAGVIAGLAATVVRAGDFWRAYPLVTYLAEYATVLAVMLLVWRRFADRQDRWQARTAAWMLILLLGALLSALLPGALIYFLIAPALALLGILLSSRAPRAAAALVIGAALIQFLMFAQLLGLIELLLIDGPIFAVAPLAALAILPILIELDRAGARPAISALGFLAAALWLAALVVPRASAERPAAFTLDYFRDDAAGAAHWAIASKQAPLPPAMPGQWKKKALAYNARLRWVSQAPRLETPRPEVRLIRSEPLGQGRRIWLRLGTGGGNALAIRFTKETPLRRLGLADASTPVPATGEPEKALLRCSGRSCDNLVIEAVLADRKPVVADLFATRFALPPEGASLAARRPADAHAQYAPDSSIRMRRVRFW